MFSRQIKFISIIAIVLMGVISCEGPVGPTGPQGESGKQGPRGEEGAVGSANVTSYLFTDLEWSGSARSINIFYDEVFNISDEVKEEGVVLFYIKFDASPNVWWPAPAPYILVGDEQYSIVAAFGNGAIVLLLRNPDGTQIPANEDVINVAALRVILVPPGALITSEMVPNDMISLSYDEVAIRLRLHE